MLTFTLAISCLTTSNLLWFMDLRFQVTIQYSIDHAFITSHIHNWVLFLLWLHPFILSGVISLLVSSSILGTYQHGKFIFQCPIILPFHTVHGVLKTRAPSLYWLHLSLPFPQFQMTRNFDSVSKFLFWESESDWFKLIFVKQVILLTCYIPTMADSYFISEVHNRL